MFGTLEQAPPDAILGIAEAFRNDSSPDKINLSVGVYKDENGQTPILDCVREAERRLIQDANTKSYLGIDGMPEFCRLTRDLLLGSDHQAVTSQRALTVQTPGGTGALRVAGDFIRSVAPDARVWCSNPTWANHPKVFSAAGLQTETYPYFDPATNGIAFKSMINALQDIPAGDVICLHACCHNPTGVDPTPQQWKTIGDVIFERGLLPLLDFAYQGFATGLNQDASAVHELCRPGQELLIANSFSKNFGLYCERIGAITAVAENSEAATVVLSHLKTCVRTNYSNPPAHGAAIVATILDDAELRQQWESELATMRNRIHHMRTPGIVDRKSRNLVDSRGYGNAGKATTVTVIECHFGHCARDA